MKFIAQLLLCSPLVSGFIFTETFIPKTGLNKLAELEKHQRLTVNLNIGKEGDSRLSVSGFILDLQNDILECGNIVMPGINGPHPKLSSGIRKINVAEEGHFISKLGTEIVHVANACWEMVWRDNADSGFLICGLDVSEEYNRNEARLPKGRTYISFTVWTKETLEEVQKKKKQILQRAEKYRQKKAEELAKMQATGNIFMKAVHYGNAYAAAVNYCFQPLDGINDVPDTPENVIEIQKNLFIYPTGVVWSQRLPHGKHVVLGSAGLSPIV